MKELQLMMTSANNWDGQNYLLITSLMTFLSIRTLSQLDQIILISFMLRGEGQRI